MPVLLLAHVPCHTVRQLAAQPWAGIKWITVHLLGMCSQAKLAQEAMQALELGADSEPALTGHSSRDLIIPKGL